jgi:hypothetical protein
MSLKDNITLSMSYYDGHYLVINALVQYYTFFYVWLTCIDTSMFGF